MVEGTSTCLLYTSEEENPTLTIENVRDYAVVYADGKLQGYLKDSSKSLSLIHILPIYPRTHLHYENIQKPTRNFSMTCIPALSYP